MSHDQATREEINKQEKGAKDAINFSASAFRSDAGWRTVNPSASARSFTGLGAT